MKGFAASSRVPRPLPITKVVLHMAGKLLKCVAGHTRIAPMP
jgi:hypothetical protein